MRPRLEQLIATRTPARRSRKIFRKIPIALALALVCLRLLLGNEGRSTRAQPVPVTPTLLTPLLVPLRCRAIAPRRTPTSPLSGRILARLAAIPRKRMGRLERPLTPLQQANTRIPTSGTLNRTVG